MHFVLIATLTAAILSASLAGPAVLPGPLETPGVQQTPIEGEPSGGADHGSAVQAAPHRAPQPVDRMPVQMGEARRSVTIPEWLRPFQPAFMLIMLGLFAAAGWLVRVIVHRRRRAEAESMPILAFQLRNPDGPAAPGERMGIPQTVRARIDAAPVDVSAPEPARESADSQQASVPPTQQVQAHSPDVPPLADTRQPVSAPQIAEGTLQLLPGRLEVASGNDRRKEIRFVKLPGPAVVTFGRYAGEPHTHVQVDSPTVSRLHARMRFASGCWHISNLSVTNPVVVNNEALANGAERILSDGDLVEMGDVVFRFRSR